MHKKHLKKPKKNPYIIIYPFKTKIILIFFKKKRPSNFQNLITTYSFTRTLFFAPFPFCFREHFFPSIFKNCSRISQNPIPSKFQNPITMYPFFQLYFLHPNKIYIKSHPKTSLLSALFHHYIKSHSKNIIINKHSCW